MKKRMVKLGEIDKFWFDKTWMTNGHWVVKVSRYSVSDKGLRALVDAGQKCSRDQVGKIESGEGIHMPHIEGVIPQDLYGWAPAKVTPWRFVEFKTFAAVAGEGHAVVVDERYLPIIDAADEIRLETKYVNRRLVALDADKQIIAVVMPYNPKRVHGLQEFLDCAKGIIK